MLHPDLRQELEKVGARIEHGGYGATRVRVSGADRVFTFYPPRRHSHYTPVEETSAEDRQAVNEGPHEELARLNTRLHGGDSSVVPQMVSEMTHGLVSVRLPGYSTDRKFGHGRTITVQQHYRPDHGVRHTIVFLNNHHTGAADARSSNPENDDVLSNTAHSLARRLIEGDVSAAEPLVDAYGDAHGHPDQYARHYAAVYLN